MAQAATVRYWREGDYPAGQATPVDIGERDQLAHHQPVRSVIEYDVMNQDQQDILAGIEAQDMCAQE